MRGRKTKEEDKETERRGGEEEGGMQNESRESCNSTYFKR